MDFKFKNQFSNFTISFPLNSHIMQEIKRITAVSYLNTKPFLYGLLHHPIHKKITIELNIPSSCAQKMISGEIDLGLIPVAAIPEIPNAQIISDYCIGAEGAVKTVCIYSNVPIEEVTHLFLDFHSRTSVVLAQLLLEKYWRLDPILVPTENGYIENINGTKAGIVIGDKSIGLEKKFKFVYDLAFEWSKFTGGLPFVFAAWVSTKPLSEEFIKEFNAALKFGLAHIPELILLLPSPESDFSLKDYYTKYISYNLDAQKRIALDKFLSYVREKNVNAKQLERESVYES